MRTKGGMKAMMGAAAQAGMSPGDLAKMGGQQMPGGLPGLGGGSLPSGMGDLLGGKKK
jgi:signal recognition particle subunit SRP54